jgi:hypothetical protein
LEPGRKEKTMSVNQPFKVSENGIEPSTASFKEQRSWQEDMDRIYKEFGGFRSASNEVKEELDFTVISDCRKNSLAIYKEVQLS